MNAGDTPHPSGTHPRVQSKSVKRGASRAPFVFRTEKPWARARMPSETRSNKVA